MFSFFMYLRLPGCINRGTRRIIKKRIIIDCLSFPLNSHLNRTWTVFIRFTQKKLQDHHCRKNQEGANAIHPVSPVICSSARGKPVCRRVRRCGLDGMLCEERYGLNLLAKPKTIEQIANERHLLDMASQNAGLEIRFQSAFFFSSVIAIIHSSFSCSLYKLHKVLRLTHCIG
jgi:hypothetical protein